tara:strand:- start:6 stop:1535 length:1530 start_codon:yes stop_codon:yes gene_type:complete
LKIFEIASEHADRPAVIMTGSKEQLSYGEMLERACRLAAYFREAGLRRGDCIAIMLENNPRYFEVYWAAMISGFFCTPVNSHLSADETTYIVNDCGAKGIVTSIFLAEVVENMQEEIPNCNIRLMMDGVASGFSSYENALANSSPEPPENPHGGSLLLYSSGTTGRPKGIYRPLPVPGNKPATSNMLSPFGIGSDTVYLSPGPLYHAAPLGFATGAQLVGSTVLVMEKFDPEEALRAIEMYQVSHSQWVPTMFSRMLKLPKEVREKYNMSCHKMAIHGAAPCPPEVKRSLIDWWGPILLEYYSGSEGNGMTLINSRDWLSHPGSVGRAMMGIVHICDDDGNELPTGEDGLIYFEQKRRISTYLNDDKKTADSAHPKHSTWTALGDVGHVDEEGFVYLTDRKTELIISGGVNIYPAETENWLITHDKIVDVAVIGVPDEEFGESVMAIVQLASGVTAGPDLVEELIAFSKLKLASFKCPRTIDFTDELPRLPTGKLYMSGVNYPGRFGVN